LHCVGSAALDHSRSFSRRLINRITPGTVRKINKGKMPFVMMVRSTAHSAVA